jgi:hypothetical protein
MNKTALLVLTSAAFLNSCSNDDLNGPFDFAGSCDVFDVEDTTLDTDPATVSRFEILANCDMGSEIGETGAVVDMVVTSNDVDNTLAMSWQAFYNASQTDIMVASFEGTGTSVSPTTFNFSGTESYDGGTNDFDDIFGSGEISGGTLTITAPGSGGWTVVGQID